MKLEDAIAYMILAFCAGSLVAMILITLLDERFDRRNRKEVGNGTATR